MTTKDEVIELTNKRENSIVFIEGEIDAARSILRETRDRKERLNALLGQVRAFGLAEGLQVIEKTRGFDEIDETNIEQKLAGVPKDTV